MTVRAAVMTGSNLLVKPAVRYMSGKPVATPPDFSQPFAKGLRPDLVKAPMRFSWRSGKNAFLDPHCVAGLLPSLHSAQQDAMTIAAGDDSLFEFNGGVGRWGFALDIKLKDASKVYPGRNLAMMTAYDQFPGIANVGLEATAQLARFLKVPFSDISTTIIRVLVYRVGPYPLSLAPHYDGHPAMHIPLCWSGCTSTTEVVNGNDRTVHSASDSVYVTDDSLKHGVRVKSHGPHEARPFRVMMNVTFS